MLTFIWRGYWGIFINVFRNLSPRSQKSSSIDSIVRVEMQIDCVVGWIKDQSLLKVSTNSFLQTSIWIKYFDPIIIALTVMFHLLRKINAFEMCALECFYVDSYASSFYSASHKSFVPDKKWFAFSKIGFCVGTEVFEEALYAVKFLGWLRLKYLDQHETFWERTRHLTTNLQPI